MCNLYSQRKPREELRGLFRISGNRIGEIRDRVPEKIEVGSRNAEDGH